MTDDCLDQYEFKQLRSRKNDKVHRVRYGWYGNGHILKLIGRDTDQRLWEGADSHFYSSRDFSNRFCVPSFDVSHSMGKKKRWELVDNLSSTLLAQQANHMNRTASVFRIDNDKTCCCPLYFNEFGEIHLFCNHLYKIRESHQITTMPDRSSNPTIISNRGTQNLPTCQKTELAKLEDESVGSTKTDEYLLHEKYYIVNFKNSNSLQNSRRRHGNMSRPKNKVSKTTNHLHWRDDIKETLEYSIFENDELDIPDSLDDVTISSPSRLLLSHFIDQNILDENLDFDFCLDA